MPTVGGNLAWICCAVIARSLAVRNSLFFTLWHLCLTVRQGGSCRGGRSLLNPLHRRLGPYFARQHHSKRRQESPCHDSRPRQALRQHLACIFASKCRCTAVRASYAKTLRLCSAGVIHTTHSNCQDHAKLLKFRSLRFPSKLSTLHLPTANHRLHRDASSRASRHPPPAITYRGPRLWAHSAGLLTVHAS